jgi:hypothetical protein
MKLKLFSLFALCIFITTFVTPIPLASITEQRKTYKQGRDLILEQLIPPEPIEVDIHEAFRYGHEVITIDVLGTGFMVGEDMHAELAFNVQTYYERSQIVSQQAMNRSIVIPKYAEKRAWIIEQTDDTEYKLADEDWGTFDTYDWRGRNHIIYPGSDIQAIDFDHMDNYYEYHAEQWNLDWEDYEPNWKTTTYHYGKYQIDQAKITGDIIPLLGPLGVILGSGLGPIAALVFAILALLIISVYLFTVWIVESEMGDGWAYAWDYGGGYISFGYWRDWWWAL